MDPASEAFVLDVLREHNIMTLATIREDGYPQATTVTFVNEGTTIYCAVEAESQKANNIRHCNKVSLTIDHDVEDWNKIKALSMAATAEIVTDTAEAERIGALTLAKFPQLKDMPEPEPGSYVFIKISPKVISLLDYTKGFGHTELVEA